MKHHGMISGTWFTARLIKSKTIFTFFLILFLFPFLSFGAGARDAGQTQTRQRVQKLYQFQGRVFNGQTGDRGRPIPGVRVSLYGANNPYPAPGRLLRSMDTDKNGWYGLAVFRGKKGPDAK